MKVLKFCLPSTVIAAGVLLSSLPSYGTPAYAKKEGNIKCTVCHTAMGKKDLNDTGKCYKDHDHSLAACKTT